jgi:hypothetical protein
MCPATAPAGSGEEWVTVGDEASAALAGIRERAKAAAELNVDVIAELISPGTRSIAGWIAASALDVPPLVKAIEAALELAGSAKVRQQVYLPGGATRPISWDLDPARLREAITTALTATGEPL